MLSLFSKWRRRWFALRQSGELPGQYYLDYYANRNCRRPKGSINLDLCEQVDAGLHMERSGNGTFDPKIRGSVFTIQTQSRTYHLEADCESDMEKWVDAICRVCGLRATDDSSSVIGTFQNNLTNEQQDPSDCIGPYIPISECITGVRAQDSQRAFTFDPKNIVTSTRLPFERVTENRSHHMYLSQPLIRLNNMDFSENESNISDEECKSLNASQFSIRDWSVAKSFTKLAIAPVSNPLSGNGPPVPPRPPKTFTINKELSLKESQNSQKVAEIMEPYDSVSMHSQRPPCVRMPRRMSHGAAQTSPNRLMLNTYSVRPEDEEDASGHPSLQYCNLTLQPPAVDRALKPRHSSHSIGHINSINGQIIIREIEQNDDVRADVLQYLDLDLHTSKPISSQSQDTAPRRATGVSHGKSLSVVDNDSAYKTVDFLKTEAFNITRQDAEASRNTQH